MKEHVCTARLIWLMVCIVAGFATAKEIRPLPPPEFSDTEVTACHRIDQDGRSVGQIDFWLSFNGTASNNVEVAFGKDSDSDGDLSPQETDLVIGWDCGRYFIERSASHERIEEADVGMSGGERTLNWHYLVGSDRTVFKSFSVTNETGVAFAELSATRPEWLYSRVWNLMRLTARGPGVQHERFFIDILFKGFVMTLR